MSLGGSHPPLLILSNSIYAKRKDGNFYPGYIVNKLDDSYTVRFPDGGCEHVLEENITWLGFWDLPPWSWPKNPVIQPAVTPWRHFQGLRTFRRDSTDLEGHETWPQPEINQPFVTSVADGSEFQDLEERTCISTHVLPEKRDSNQSRSSVLRLNSNVLLRERNHNNFLTQCVPSREILRVGHTSPPCTSSQSPKNYREEEFDLESIIVSSTNDKTTQTKNPTGDLRNEIETGGPSEVNKSMHHCSLARETYPVHDVGIPHPPTAEEFSMACTDLEYSTRHFRSTSPDQSGCSSSMTPPHFITPQLPFHGHPLGMSVVGASPLAAIPLSFRLQTKTSKKDEQKKCRKVYGIENRHIWCTQCKWKKACTRFPTANKIISSRFV